MRRQGLLSTMEHSKPLGIDLYAGLGGWTDGLLAEGYDVIGFDIERHDYGTGGYPAQLVLQDVTTLHGRQFKGATLIVASPPCQEYSYMAMPWTLAKEKQKKIEASPAEQKRLTTLFDACFRIQREAIEAAGHFIPMVVENVRGAQKWVGKADWHYGSFYLWGDVPVLMPNVTRREKKTDCPAVPVGKLFRETGQRVSHITTGHLEDRKLPGFRFDGSGKSFQTASVEGTKAGHDWFGGYGGNFGWDCSPMRRNNSRSSARKAASAAIAKIPFPLAQYIARYYKDYKRSSEEGGYE